MALTENDKHYLDGMCKTILSQSTTKIRQTVEETVRETIPKSIDEHVKLYGIDSENKIEMQKQFAFLSNLHKMVTSMVMKMTALIIAIVTVAAIAWKGLISNMVGGK